MRATVQPALLSLLLLVATCAFSVGQTTVQGLQTEERPTKVSGTVVNAVTGAPIPRALVHSPDDHFATLTDGEGHFEFAIPKPESEQNSTSPSPFDSLERRGWFTALKPGFLDDPEGRVEQVEAAQGSELTIPLIPEALIKGRVMVSESDAALGINVEILVKQVQDGMPQWVHAGATRANSNGEFRFAELHAGTYKLLTHELMDNDPAATIPGGQLYGFPPVYFPGVADIAAAGMIELTAGQTVAADIPLARQPYYQVQIPVANAEDNSGLNIKVSVLGHRGPGYSLGYEADRQRIEGLLPNGSYLVEAASFGQHAVTGSVGITVAGGPLDGPGMTLIPKSSIHLNVTEEFTGEWNGGSRWIVGKQSFSLRGPRAYLQARLESADDLQQTNAMLRQPKSPSDDQLVIDDVEPGRYWLRLNSSRGYVASATLGGVDLLHQSLAVAPGSSAPIEIRMRDDFAQVEGTVTGISTDGTATNRPRMPEFYVYCVPLPDSPGQFEQLGMTSDDGKFESQNMAPGTYRILAFKTMQRDLPYRDAEAMKTYETRGQVVHLSPGQKAIVQVQIISE
jgi:hypothetical protein